MHDVMEFISLALICAGLGIDNGLLVELSIKSLGFEQRKHLIWRSVALFIAALMRIGLLFILSSLAWMKNKLPDSGWVKPLRMISHHPDELTWMNLVFLIGGFIIIAMAFWELYHKYRELRYAEEHGDHDDSNPKEATAGAIMGVILYLIVMNLIFSLDSVFTSVAMMDLETKFWHMVGAIILASIIMIVGMVPLSELISKSQHFSVTMLVVLVLIAAKLMVDGVGEHFPNSVLILMLVAILVNDGVQAFFDRAAEKGRAAKTVAP